MKSLCAALVLCVLPGMVLAAAPTPKLDVTLKQADLVVVGTLGKLTPIDKSAPIDKDPPALSGVIEVTQVLKGPADCKSVVLRTQAAEKTPRAVTPRAEGAKGIWILRKHADGQRYSADRVGDLLPMTSLAAVKKILPAPEASREPPPSAEWTTLSANEQWYKDHKQTEKVFAGKLVAVDEPAVSTMMRSHRYKVGDRLLYPGSKHPDLEKLVGKEVEVKGKPYDVALAGQAVSEIWAAAVRLAPAAPAAAGKQGTAAGNQGTLVGRIVDKQGNPVENAKVYIYLPKPTKESNLTRLTDGKTKADGTFEIAVEAHDDLVVNVIGPNQLDAWGKGGIVVKAGEKTDLGDIRIAPLRM